MVSLLQLIHYSIFFGSKRYLEVQMLKILYIISYLVKMMEIQPGPEGKDGNFQLKNVNYFKTSRSMRRDYKSMKFIHLIIFYFYLHSMQCSPKITTSLV